jgi:hypothetical protein
MTSHPLAHFAAIADRHRSQRGQADWTVLAERTVAAGLATYDWILMLDAGRAAIVAVSFTDVSNARIDSKYEDIPKLRQ